MLSPTTPTLTTYASATNNEVGLATTAGLQQQQQHHKVQVILYLTLVFKCTIWHAPIILSSGSRCVRSWISI
jgi:hypothetical protein